MWQLIKAIALDKSVRLFIVCMVIFWSFMFIFVDCYWKSCSHNPGKKIVCVEDNCQCVDKDAKVKEF